jgi:solute:Na+ symporter, SSS family
LRARIDNLNLVPHRWLDLAVIAAYLGGITWFGARFRSSQKSLRDYFLGGKSAPWWAIALSIVSAETSTLTVIGTPALAFQGNFEFLQLILGYLLARVAIAVLFLPAYFRGELFTAYQLIRQRFGERAGRFSAAIFLVLRALAEGVRVFAISIVVSVFLNVSSTASIAAILCLTLFYTYEGGMTAVIWTDALQMALYLGGAIFSLAAVLRQIPGGWAHVAAICEPLGKFQVFDFRLGPPGQFFARTYSFWAGIIGGCFLTAASHGTEQLMVQRLLAARSERESRAALFASWIVVAAQFTLFLIIGACLFVFYSDRHFPPPPVADSVYPRFVWDFVPSPAAGLIVAAILAAAMSNLSAALNSLASTTVLDFCRPLMRRTLSEKAWLQWARRATVAWGITLFAVALAARHWGNVLQAGLSIASVLYGALLGVFLLGVLTRRVRESSAIVGMIAGLVLMIFVRFATAIAFTWYVLLGSAATFAAGCAASFVWGSLRTSKKY